METIDSVVASRISSSECEGKQYFDPISDDYKRDFNNLMGKIVWSITNIN
jgi:hypothetical protein